MWFCALLDKLEQMDMDTLKEFGMWLEAEGLQAIATRVSTGEECSIIIEDGYVTGQEMVTEAQKVKKNGKQVFFKWRLSEVRSRVQKVVIYGWEGIGKSTFASQFPDPVFIDTEGSTNSMDVARLPKASSWQMILQRGRLCENPSGSMQNAGH